MAARLLLLAALLTAFPACVQDDGSRFNPFRVLVPKVDENDELELGLEFDHELRKHVQVIDDPIVAGFANDLGGAIVGTIDQPYIYRFRVVRDSSLNAFAVPGGFVYLHSGTVMAVGSIDELAGVLGHEIAHVREHHFARAQAKSQPIDLIAGLVGMAAAVVAEEPGLMVATQAANVAVQLQFSREFVVEADHFGAVFATRAGFDPAGSAYFFERIIEEQKQHPNNIPPYLFTHPDPGDRVEGIRQEAQTLHPTHDPDPELVARLRTVQARLSHLTRERRATLPSPAPPPDRARVDRILDDARKRAEDGENDEALSLLTRAERMEPNDPRVSFEAGNRLYELGRYEEAAAAYRRTVALDPSRALIFFKLGQAYKAQGDAHRAVYAFEQAEVRAGSGSQLRGRAQWEVIKLTFPVLATSGFADGAPSRGADTPAGNSRDAFASGDAAMVWWARLGPRFVSHGDEVHVRWTDPDGAVVRDEPVSRLDRTHVQSSLPLAGARPLGVWTVEATLEGDVIDRRTIEFRANL
jgi:predicted Zn-dependent protease